jgi:uncharacterized FAD-dependent dehydrogenase
MKTYELVLLPEEAADKQLIEKAFFKIHGDVAPFTILKRSLDARSRKVVIRLLVAVLPAAAAAVIPERKWQAVNRNEPVLIIGCGPAGLFAAIELIEKGFKPILVDRGKNVRDRRRDLAAINKQHVINENSNYCFGEGGAGTYSDGKLYTRSTKRGDVGVALNTFIEFGASPAIAIDAHPHIGTNKLPAIIAAMRERILSCGGEILFNTLLTDIHVSGSAVTGAQFHSLHNNSLLHLKAHAIILATGHSARDVFYLLQRKKINIEAKPFALGIRAEHQQGIIDAAQYHCKERNPYLPPASYALSHQHEGHGVYSFCMCPGGIIAPAATAHGEVVVNGWSPSRRNNPFANAGIVVNVTEDDVKSFAKHGPLRFLEFQKKIEQQASESAGGNLKAPAQRMVDFVNGNTSATLPACSYIPGTTAVNLNTLFPAFITDALRAGFQRFGKQINGYYSNEAILVGVESRTSSPVRIPRNKESGMHEQVAGLFPCGEGAGYAGGIISAALDGAFSAAKCVEFLKHRNEK